MKNLNIIFVANELDNTNLNGPNVVFFNIIKTICLNESQFDKGFKFYFLVPENFNFNYFDIYCKASEFDIYKLKNNKLITDSKKINFIKLKINNKIGLFLTISILKKLGNNYVILYPKLTYLPFLKNQIAFLYDLPLEKRYLINSVNLKENIQKQFFFKKLVINNLKFIFTISKSVKEDIIEFLGVDKIDYVYLGVDHDIFKPLNKIDLSRYDLKYKNYFFYPAGKLWYRKNIINLLLAFYRLINYSENYKNIELVITANNYNNLKDRYVFEVRKLIEEYKLNKNIRFMYVDNKEMVNLYNGAMAVIFSSFYEGFGLPILESLACKIPILFSDIPVFNEIFNENIFKFDPNDVDSIYFHLKNFLEINLKEDNKELDRIIKLGYKKSFSFKWLNTVKNLLVKIESIIDKE
ncbi:MAG: glycosyltransferase family 4 protein [bacterium]